MDIDLLKFTNKYCHVKYKGLTPIYRVYVKIYPDPTSKVSSTYTFIITNFSSNQSRYNQDGTHLYRLCLSNSTKGPNPDLDIETIELY